MNSALVILAVLTTLSEVRQSLQDRFQTQREFAVTATVIRAGHRRNAADTITSGYLVTQDGEFLHFAQVQGYLSVSEADRIIRHPPAAVGDLVAMTGHTGLETNGWHCAYIDSIRRIGKGTIPAAMRISADRLRNADLANHPVEIEGIIANVIPDDIDPRYCYLSMRSPDGPFLTCFGLKAAGDRTALAHMIGTTVLARGIARPSHGSGKRKFRNVLLFAEGMKDLTVIRPVPENPFDAPEIDELEYLPVSTITGLGLRRTTGRVLSVQHDGRVLLRSDRERLIGVTFPEDELPDAGDRVEVVGFPDTDMFILRLSNARFRRIPGDPVADEPPVDVNVRDLLSGPYGDKQVAPEFYGKTVRLHGQAVSLPDAAGQNTILTLASDGRLVPVDTFACMADLPTDLVGAEVAVTGVCALNTDTWRPTDIVPRIDGFTLVLRSARDLEIVSRPPWWTIRKLTIIIVILFTILVGIAIWNRILQRIIERRSRQLLKSEIAKVESDLRVDERTRLATEIHDSLAQTLTGVSFQIDAAADTIHADADAAGRFLAVAKSTLHSCREELRRCLWDLRSHTIEDPDLNDAIRKTIRPGIGPTQTFVRFNVPRCQLSDTTAHAVLCIVRELSVNAVRHGRATCLRIAGEKRDGIVRFSVRDDGTGFDPESCPGPSQGHFGLQGIRERLGRINGTLRIESAPGKGTKAIVEIGK